MEFPANNELISQIKKGEYKAFEVLFGRFWERLYAFSFKMTSDRELSQNIVQDIFIDVWERRHVLEIRNIESYLFKAVKFQVFNYYRDRKMNREVLQDRFEDYTLEHQEKLNHDLLSRLEESLRKLPEKRGVIFRMSKIQNLPVDEIACQLNLSRQTVKNQLSQAFKQLKADLHES
ncbi:RNA polymerase sigma factor [Prolixibacter sp. NT017]|uniref:RNA polymerase sigma factor n=1 Tax=Prolixibacter sp. NT017 TaxID=2652390 RepID=UPI0012860489|nr:sigma-70 family RNA polymerase sigma factor [Prolixibacter sp. NT017]GET25632.1 DNA-directed RNA polymerase sigma-70 factor [Prolixibacter sp. NT017]